VRTLLVLLIALFGVPAAHAQLPDVVLRDYQGKPAVFIDGTPRALPGYSTFRREAFEQDLPLFYEHGMGVYFIEPPRLWWDGGAVIRDREAATEAAGTGNATFISLDEMAERILAGDPEAWIIVRFTPRARADWQATHPEEYFVTEENDPTLRPTPSLASDLFWATMAEVSAEVIRHVESRPWAERVIGYANFHVTEGTHAPVHQAWLFDQNPLMRNAYRDYLRSKYTRESALQAAYGDLALTFDTAEVPTDRLRGTVPEVSQLDYWQDAVANRPLRDYLELQATLWHRHFRSIGRAMEDAADRNVLLIHDSLKQTMQGWSNWGFFKYGQIREDFAWRLAYPETMAGSGHIGIAELLDAPGFDGLITPHDYQARGIGGVYEPEGIVDSMILRGKFFMAEMDTRTWLMGRNGIGRTENLKELAAVTWRNLATSFTRGFTSYWMEFGEGWWRSKEVQELVGVQTAVIKESIEWPHATVPGIAMIIDDRATLDTNGDGSFLNESVMSEWKFGLSRAGVPRNIYLLEDLELDNFPPHRVFYFPNLFRVTDAKLALLREKVFRDGNVVVWGPGSGISDGEVVGVESAERLTGFRFESIGVNSPRRVHVTNADHPVTKSLPADTIFGSLLSYGPVLLPLDGEPLGIAWTKGGHRHTGLAVIEHGRGAARRVDGVGTRGEGDYAEVFTVAVPLPAAIWRNIARFAGAHVYAESNDVLLANSNVVALHSAYSGPRTISLPGTYRVRDIVSGEVLAESTDTITFDLDAPETRLFLLESEP
jgi:hypothetical protein